MNEQPISTNQPTNMNGWTRSWFIFRSAWRVLVLDKEVLAIPTVAGFISLIIAIAGFVGGLALTPDATLVNTYSENNDSLTAATYGVWIITSLILALISTYTMAAVVAITLQRLRGQDPTISSGLA